MPRFIDQHIQADNNSGNTTQTNHNTVVNVNRAQATIVEGPRTDEARPGVWCTQYLVQLSMPVSRIALQAQGSGLSTIEVRRRNSTTVLFELRRWKFDGGLEIEFANASGEYVVMIEHDSPAIPIIANKITP